MTTVELAIHFDRIMAILSSDHLLGGVPVEVHQTMNRLRALNIKQSELSKWQLPVLVEMITQLDLIVTEVSRQHLEVAVVTNEDEIDEGDCNCCNCDCGACRGCGEFPEPPCPVHA